MTSTSSDSRPFDTPFLATLFLLPTVEPCDRVRKTELTHEKAGFLSFQKAGRKVAQAQVSAMLASSNLSCVSAGSFVEPARATHLKTATYKAYHIWSLVLKLTALKITFATPNSTALFTWNQHRSSPSIIGTTYTRPMANTAVSCIRLFLFTCKPLNLAIAIE